MDNNIPLISVIIPVYNTAEFIKRCLDSVLGNTYKNLEVICVNDGSTDNSGIILQKIASSDDRIIVVNKENGGLSSARNAGIEQAQGEYTVFVDSDDWVHPQYFELMINALKQYKTDIAGCSYIKTGKYDENFKEYDKNDIKAVVEKADATNNMRYAWGLIFKTETVRKYRFPDLIGKFLAEDIFFNICLIAGECDCGNELTIASINEPLCFYFQREDSLIKTAKHSIGQLKAAEEYLNLAQKLKTDRAKAILIERSFKSALLFRYLEMFSDGYKTKKKDANKVLKRAVEMCRQNKAFDFKKKEFYIASVKFPALYRLYRIVTDPTMIAWEKEQKSKK